MIRKGTKVTWNWGSGTAQGKVQETFSESVTKAIKGTEVTRNGTDDNKALYIQQEDGDYVLKSESEVERADSWLVLIVKLLSFWVIELLSSKVSELKKEVRIKLVFKNPPPWGELAGTNLLSCLSHWAYLLADRLVEV